MRRIKILMAFFLILISCQSKSESKNESKSIVDTIQQSEKQKKTELTEPNDTLVVSKISATKIPNSITYIGKFKEGYIWKNRNEHNIIFITETGEFQNKNKDARNAALYAYCYNLKNNDIILNWKVYDFISDCPVDIMMEYTNEASTITDLDKNGIAETWLVYKMSCKGDISPNKMKIIMYEGKQKFAMRGEDKVQIGMSDNNEPVIYGGTYKFDKSFSEGPEVFKDYAKQLWTKNL